MSSSVKFRKTPRE